jgi:hypothetical protein
MSGRAVPCGTRRFFLNVFPGLAPWATSVRACGALDALGDERAPVAFAPFVSFVVRLCHSSIVNLQIFNLLLPIRNSQLPVPAAGSLLPPPFDRPRSAPYIQ